MNIISKINPNQVQQDWHSKGYSFGVFRDPPRQVWADYVHQTDELVVLAEGEIEVKIEGKLHKPKIGQKMFIPAYATHTVRNVGSMRNVWYYAFRKTED